MRVANAERVEIEVNGMTYQASYIVREDVVTVEYEGEEISTQAGNISADIVACHLLFQMVHDKRPKH